ncbi:hypothetical protein Tsubulata_018101 [Turnera subulata]|uniref:Fatty acid hydroxylase domain-containing protein n=1 Tax=Turnera subulata TaxID=218843 RepID=A0A9Q0FJI6_9ROSI|nr:hypothetical protein Tsubulata_018101 [Turnera subulata]
MASKPGILTDWPWKPLGSFKGERDDQILFTGILFYVFNRTFPQASGLPFWRTDGMILIILLHVGPVEFLYYWLHRALHHHYLYSRYHSHHHSSIVTQPITSVIHPFAEHIAYFMLFAIPLLTSVFTGTASIASVFLYVIFIDFMNNMGHCNFELIPNWLFSIFPPLKYIMYTPSFHSLHHTQFRTNYSLFMPFYDYIYNTLDKSSDTLYQNSLKRTEDSPDVVYLMHLTTPESIYHLQLGFASLASKPYIHSKWDAINKLIEESIIEADKKGVKGEELNGYGALYVQKNPGLKVKVVDGSSLVVAIVLNSIPKGTTQVLLRGKLTKVAYAIAFALCQRGIQVATLHKHEKEKLKVMLPTIPETNLLVHTKSSTHKNWLPRRVMSGWRIAGILHAKEGWDEHECGHTMLEIDRVWKATLRHGFRPLATPTKNKTATINILIRAK